MTQSQLFNEVQTLSEKYSALDSNKVTNDHHIQITHHVHHS